MAFWLNSFWSCVRKNVCIFLDASSHLYKRPCPSVGWLVGWSVGNAFVQIDEKWPFTDSKWFRQCWTRKKEGRGGRRDEEAGSDKVGERASGARRHELRFVGTNWCKKRKKKRKKKENKAQRPTMRPQAFLGISSHVRDARRKSEYGNSHP